jgi:hypothetical protein
MDLTPQRRKRVLTALAVAAAIAAVAVLAEGCLPDKGAWVKENNHLIDSVPLYPGAVERGPRVTQPLQGGRLILSAAIGYYTSATFSLPKAMSREQLSRYYAKHLPVGWSCHAAGSAAIECLKGKAQLRFLFPNAGALRTYRIQADKGYQDDKDAGN